MKIAQVKSNLNFWRERTDLAAAFRWTARLNMHEAVANHFSLTVSNDGTKFLVNFKYNYVSFNFFNLGYKV